MKSKSEVFVMGFQHFCIQKRSTNDTKNYKKKLVEKFDAELLKNGPKMIQQWSPDRSEIDQKIDAKNQAKKKGSADAKSRASVRPLVGKIAPTGRRTGSGSSSHGMLGGSMAPGRRPRIKEY